MAVNRWLQVQQPSGLLPYGYDFLEDTLSEPHNVSPENLVRQALSAAVLADYYAQTGDHRTRKAIERFIEAFDGRSLPIGKSRTQDLVEWTRVLAVPVGRTRLSAALDHFGLLYQRTGPGKVVSPDASYSGAFTGAVAFALLTELRYARASGDHRFANLRRSWFEGLIALRMPGNGFRQSPTSIESNAYVDGQAWLAIAEYHRAFPEDQRVNSLLEVLDTELLDKFEHTHTILMFHWGAMAAAARFSDTNDEKFLDFLKSRTSKFLLRVRGHDDNDNNCAAVEGLADIMGALLMAGEKETDLFKRASDWTAAEMRKARSLQIQPGQRELVFTNARIIVPRMPEFAGDFRSGIYSADTQVDLTGHCVSAMLKLARSNLEF